MRADDLRPRHWARSLRTRLIAFLTIALLPLGAIAVLQTVQVIEETAQLAERDALARTARAAEEQGAVLQSAFGAAYALGTAAAQLEDAPDRCSDIMVDFIAMRPDFVFAGFIAADGMMDCNNTGSPVDFRGTEDWETFIADPSPNVGMNRNGQVSGQSVYIVFVPIFDPDTETLLGGQAVSIPHAFSRGLFDDQEGGLDLALINPEGTILASSTGMDHLTAFEQFAVVPGDMDVPPRGILLERGAQGEDARPAALVPLIPGQIYVLGLWTPGEINIGMSWAERTIPVFPLLMWLASLAVAYITVNNLIMKPLARLSSQMRRYHADHPEAAIVTLQDAPTEVIEIAKSYNTVLHRVTEDTARLEESVAEKETLLREVHHRVKNNLQLISSILNMQMRGVEDGNARRILSRVQDRVMSLSSVHRALYTDNQLQSVRVDHLVSEIVDGIRDIAQSAGTPIDLTVDLEPIQLDPDQAVPLSLLVTEAMTNAVKYVGAHGDAKPAIDVSLREINETGITFGITNTRGPFGALDNEADGTGLGARLIKSFASQLGGEVDIEMSDLAYDLQLKFEKL